MGHETEADVARSKTVIGEFAGRRGLTAIESFKALEPDSEKRPRIDWLLIEDGRLRWGAEVKGCNFPFGVFEEGFLLKADKNTAALDLKFALSLDTLLIVEFNDALAYLNMMAFEPDTGFTLKRKDRPGVVDMAVRYHFRDFLFERADDAALNRPIASNRTVAKRASAAGG